jgi:MtN3 and saliva related transmembrane protein
MVVSRMTRYWLRYSAALDGASLSNAPGRDPRDVEAACNPWAPRSFAPCRVSTGMLHDRTPRPVLPALLTNAIGSGAALCSMFSFAPQVLKIWREKDAGGVSRRMYIVTVIGFSLWVSYGLMLHSWPLIVSNSVSLALAAVILVLKLRYGN